MRLENMILGQLKMGEHQAKYGALLHILPLLSGLGKSFHGWTFWTLYFSGLSGNLSAEPWIYERIRTRRRVSTTGFIRFHFNFLFFKLWSISWITRSSWLNCALRDDEAVYWVSIGHYEAVAVGNWWYWVSRGHLCLYILHKVEIWTGVTDAWLTHRLWKIVLLSSL